MPKNRGKEGFYGISRKFLWGSATAANQYEGGYLSGGKGLSTLDAITGGSQTEPRRITYLTKESKSFVYARSSITRRSDWLYR